MLPDIPGDSSNINFPKLEELLSRYKFQIIFILLGAILIGFGTFLIRNDMDGSSTDVEILEETSDSQTGQIIVEVAGAVEKPGVYKLDTGARIEDLLISAGGISANANRDWMEKSLNRAAKISDGQKLYIPRDDEQSEVLSANKEGVYQSVSSTFGTQGNGLININTATQKELESLPGIGPVYAQNVIEQRPYSNVEELLSRKVLRSDIYEKNKDRFTVF